MNIRSKMMLVAFALATTTVAKADLCDQYAMMTSGTGHVSKSPTISMGPCGICVGKANSQSTQTVRVSFSAAKQEVDSGSHVSALRGNHVKVLKDGQTTVSQSKGNPVFCIPEGKAVEAVLFLPAGMKVCLTLCKGLGITGDQDL